MNNPKTENSVEIDLEGSLDFSADIDNTINVNLDDDVFKSNEIDELEITDDAGFEVDLDDFILPIVDKPLGKDLEKDTTDEVAKTIKVDKTPTVNTIVNEDLLQQILQKPVQPSAQPSSQPFSQQSVENAVPNAVSNIEQQDKQQKLAEQPEQLEKTQEVVQSAVQEMPQKTVEEASGQKQKIEEMPQPALSSEVIDKPVIEEAVIKKPTTDKPKESTKEENKKEKGGWFSRMKTGLSKSRKNLADGMMNILVGGKEIDDELLEEVEDQLLVADIGVDATNRIITNLTEQTARGDLIYSHSLYKALQKELVDILEPKVEPLIIDTSKKPFVILMVGVNGVGKTTTIGKLAKRLQAEGKSVMLAAGDTFRAAATEQLQVWGERNDIPVVAQGHGSDSASVIFDAMQSAKAKGIDVLIADTAGRLQNKSHLMAELEKVVRVMQKSDPTAPHEGMIVLDAGTGQNAINQVDIFNQAVNLTGITITKLDGTAKGGVVFNIANTTDIPIRYIGVGEAIDDLRAFEPKDFVKALFDTDE